MRIARNIPNFRTAANQVYYNQLLLRHNLLREKIMWRFRDSTDSGVKGERPSLGTGATLTSSDTEYWVNQPRQQIPRQSMATTLSQQTKAASDSSDDTAFWVNQKREVRKQSDEPTNQRSSATRTTPQHSFQGRGAASSLVPTTASSRHPEVTTQEGTSMKNSETTNDTDYWLKQFDEKKANPHLTAEPEVKVYSEYDGSSGPTNSATATNSIARKPVPAHSFVPNSAAVDNWTSSSSSANNTKLDPIDKHKAAVTSPTGQDGNKNVYNDIEAENEELAEFAQNMESGKQVVANRHLIQEEEPKQEEPKQELVENPSETPLGSNKSRRKSKANQLNGNAAVNEEEKPQSTQKNENDNGNGEEKSKEAGSDFAPSPETELKSHKIGAFNPSKSSESLAFEDEKNQNTKTAEEKKTEPLEAGHEMSQTPVVDQKKSESEAGDVKRDDPVRASTRSRKTANGLFSCCKKKPKIEDADTRIETT
ncbi:uncharacterized protein LOC142336034 isoform X3 [Convolutriloba macropyga]|uniref:uncharacterized protein LOC142336034 isoform X3 n=1 Tax=Convolutriloba macropyga TaxID=536237 RepID=UPI003F52811E